MNNKETTTYKIMSQTELLNVGSVDIAGNTLSIQVQDNYTNAIKMLVEYIVIRGDFSEIKFEIGEDTNIRITNISENFIDALKEECLLKLSLVWI